MKRLLLGLICVSLVVASATLAQAAVVFQDPFTWDGANQSHTWAAGWTADGQIADHFNEYGQLNYGSVTGGYGYLTSSTSFSPVIPSGGSVTITANVLGIQWGGAVDASFIKFGLAGAGGKNLEVQMGSTGGLTIFANADGVYNSSDDETAVGTLAGFDGVSWKNGGAANATVSLTYDALGITLAAQTNQASPTYLNVSKTWAQLGNGAFNPALLGSSVNFGLFAHDVWGGNNLLEEVSVTATPEPSTLVLVASGLVGLLCYAWRKRK